MKIAIVTVYEPCTNLGSFLQCYALKTYLEGLGHSVVIIQKVPLLKLLSSVIAKINPKRAFLLRFKKCWYTYKDLKNLSIVSKAKWQPNEFDYVIYGSDEIWNLHNKYFADDLFWGINVNVPKVGYGISVGHMTPEEFRNYPLYTQAVSDFSTILPRDNRTKVMLKDYCNVHDDLVCDPTFLIPIEQLSFPIKIPKDKYILVYTYGLSNHHIAILKQFAYENGLIIISPCFWHIWADKVIECSALQLSTLIAHSEYVFTTTFHGAVFTMLNHKKCCIFSQREKVHDIVSRLGVEQHLIPEDCSINQFRTTINQVFPTGKFEMRLKKLRDSSVAALEKALSK